MRCWSGLKKIIGLWIRDILVHDYRKGNGKRSHGSQNKRAARCSNSMPPR
jgi:hypothetical protein